MLDAPPTPSSVTAFVSESGLETATSYVPFETKIVSPSRACGTALLTVRKAVAQFVPPFASDPFVDTYQTPSRIVTVALLDAPMAPPPVRVRTTVSSPSPATPSAMGVTVTVAFVIPAGRGTLPGSDL